MLSCILISKENLISNLKNLQAFLPKKTKICAVIKGNAYGHGQNEVAGILEKYIDYFQVDDIEELRLLRKVSNKQTFVFGYVHDNDLEELTKLKAIPAIYDIRRAKILDEIGRKNKTSIEIHLKIDALLGRQGILIDDVTFFCREIKKLNHLRVAGVYSHFSNIEDTESLDHAHRQLEYYNRVVDLIKKEGINDFYQHFSATSGVLTNKELGQDFDIARLGIGIYGLWPSENLRKKYNNNVQLKPIMRWVTHVAQVKEVDPGFPIGYGLTYVTKRKTRIAVIPQGYSDGFDRGLSNCGEVEINGSLYPVIGRVAMNMFCVDITNSNIKENDEVTLLGNNITAESIADKTNTINYEVISKISPLLPRVIT